MTQATQFRESTEPEEWVSLGQAAALAGLAQGTLYRKIREGVLPAYERTGRTVLKKSDVIAFMEPKPKPLKRKLRGKRG